MKVLTAENYYRQWRIDGQGVKPRQIPSPPEFICCPTTLHRSRNSHSKVTPRVAKVPTSPIFDPLHLGCVKMSAAKATVDALDPSNSSKNTLKIENVSESSPQCPTRACITGLSSFL
jgi:hypothetical protein